ncbi:MAG: hypothetical protein MUE53_09385 [Chitinophagales bacterium]|jgi:hypothetical protein|nr:hypothetical protein [Chitinophagales bacterium]
MMNIDFLKQKIKHYITSNAKDLIVFGISFLGLSLLKPTSFHSDIHYWRLWSHAILELGLYQIYTIQNIDYMPFTLYILKFFTLFFHETSDLFEHFEHFKIFALFFDLIIAFCIAKIIYPKDFGQRIFIYLLIIFNPIYLYNSLIWGQVDAYAGFWILLSLFLGYKRQTTLSMICFAVAMMTKFQAIFSLPFLFLVNGISFWHDWRKFGLGILSFLTTIAVFVLPFTNYTRIWNIVFHYVGQYPKISMNAYNIWYLIFTEDEIHKPILDMDIYLNLPLRYWGYALFFSISFFAIFPLIREFWRNRNQLEYKFSPELLLLSYSICQISFFYFLPQMHERYLQMGMYALFVYALWYRKWLIYAMFSYGFWLNMEGVLRHTKLYNYHLVIFHPITASALIFSCLLWLCLDLYRLYYHSNAKIYAP